MTHENTVNGVLPAPSDDASNPFGSVSKRSNCRRCPNPALSGYAVCSRCFEDLPEALCTSHVLGTLSE
jgi:hypothetical protein